MCLSPRRLTLGAEESVFLVPHGPNIAPRCPTAVIADKIKHIHFQKVSKNLFLPAISVLPLCSQSSQPFQPLALDTVHSSTLGLTYHTKGPKRGPPFEPLQSTSLRALSLKNALLLALASVKRVGDLQALSINLACLELQSRPETMAGLCTKVALHSVQSPGHNAFHASPLDG